ncbi:MAG: 4a-hydroxytetrahydrobiopterin dehydratase [Xenococcaceae cyanobacterium MO_188.B29]|nr:4a-hydroxytetrahydrobiopterin dehydratase [Xenococcaceae cyanobacterium MO_188.B29]
MVKKNYKPIALIIAITISLILMAKNTFNREAQANSMVFNQTQVEEKLQTLPDWKTDGETISRTFKFKDFLGSIDFVNKLVEPAEKAGHHPDITISYNKVTIDLTTHDAGGITQKDFDLAETISQLAQP